jgi:small GTP-binding protein
LKLPHPDPRKHAIASRLTRRRQGKKLAEELGMVFFETSARTKENVEQAFIDLTRAVLKRLIEQPVKPDGSAGEKVVLPTAADAGSKPDIYECAFLPESRATTAYEPPLDQPASQAETSDAAAKTPLGYDYLVKLMLVGDSVVGKSSLMLRFSDDTFDLSGTPTIGIDFKLRTIELDGKKIKLQLLDIAGQEKFRTISTAHFKNAMGFLFVYDVTKEDSFKNITVVWLRNVEKHTTGTVNMLLLGNKCDLEDKRVVSKEQVPLRVRIPLFKSSPPLPPPPPPTCVGFVP